MEPLTIDTEAKPREDKAWPAPTEEMSEVEIDGPDKNMRVRDTLNGEQRNAFTSILK